MESAVKTLAEQALANTGLISDDALKSIRLFLHAASESGMEGTRLFEQKIQEETRNEIAKLTKQIEEGGEEKQRTLFAQRATSSQGA